MIFLGVRVMYLGIEDIVFFPIYLLFSSYIMFAISKSVDKPLRQYFINGFFLKIFGFFSFAMVYQFYYGGGDTFNYFHDVLLISQSMDVSFNDWFSHIIYTPNTPGAYFNLMHFYFDKVSFHIPRFAAVINLICFDSYLCISLFFCLFSFSGLWKLYRVFIFMYPNKPKMMAIPLFYVPSLLFWGSGLMKDSVCLGALSWVIYSLYMIMVRKEKIIQNILYLSICIYLLISIKVYIIMCLLPCVMLWFIVQLNQNVKNMAVRIILTPFLIVSAIVIGIGGMVKVSEGSDRYNLDNIQNTTGITAEYLYKETLKTHGSAYNLGDFDYSTSGIIKKAPFAIWVTLFRPYIWESKNAIMLLSAIESLIFLLFTLYIIFKHSFVKWLKTIVAKPFLLFCFSFSLIFGMSVGLTSNNFGTLSRYKIPIIPFYLTGLLVSIFVIEQEIRDKRDQKRNERLKLFEDAELLTIKKEIIQ